MAAFEPLNYTLRLEMVPVGRDPSEEHAQRWRKSKARKSLSRPVGLWLSQPTGMKMLLLNIQHGF